MSETNGNGHTPGHVVLLGDHKKPRPTKAEQERQNLAAIEDRVRSIAIEVAEHYAAQMPGLIAQMVGEILHANGMELKAPESWSQIPAVAPAIAPAGHTADTVTPASDAQHAGQTDGGDAAVPESAE